MIRELSEVKYSMLELAFVNEGSQVKETYNNTLELAQLVESLGYHRFWLAEHHNSINIASSATSILIGYIAENTKSIRVGSGGIMLPNHSPLIVAEQFGTLGTLYPDRIDLGLGRAPGTDADTANAIRSDRMQATMRFPDEVADIQQYFSLDNVQNKVRATVAEGVQVPIYILGSSTDSAKLAARLGLPYAFASHFATAHFHEALQIYRHDFTPSQFLSQPYVIAGVNVIAADTLEKAEMMFTSPIRMVMNLFMGKREYLTPPTQMTSELKSILMNPSVQQMLRFSMVGDKKKVKEETEKFLAENKVDELMVVTNTFDPQDRRRSYQLFSEIMNEINGI